MSRHLLAPLEDSRHSRGSLPLQKEEALFLNEQVTDSIYHGEHGARAADTITIGSQSMPSHSLPDGLPPMDQEDSSQNCRVQKINENGTSRILSIQRHWPALDEGLFALEQLFSHTPGTARQGQHKVHQYILAQLYQAEGQYSRITRYLAFLLLRYGRGAEIVGNPVFLRRDGTRQALPYTGLEGYYVGSEQTSSYSGLSKSEILREEAVLGEQILKMLKKTAIEHNTWANYAYLRSTLQGKEQSREALKTLQHLWMNIVSRLRCRVYHNAEFQQTITEQIEYEEQMPGNRAAPGSGACWQDAAREELAQLRETYRLLTETEKAQEREERRRREKVRHQRVAALQRFRHETYTILEESNQESYNVGLRKSARNKTDLLETITLPGIALRKTYPIVEVYLTPGELDGYLFLAQIGEFGADPLARSALVSRGTFE